MCRSFQDVASEIKEIKNGVVINTSYDAIAQRIEDLQIGEIEPRTVSNSTLQRWFNEPGELPRDIEFVGLIAKAMKCDVDETKRLKLAFIFSKLRKDWEISSEKACKYAQLIHDYENMRVADNFVMNEIKHAKEEMKNENYSHAQQLLEKLIRIGTSIENETVDVYFKLGECYYRLNKFVEAREHLEKALELFLERPFQLGIRQKTALVLATLVRTIVPDLLTARLDETTPTENQKYNRNKFVGVEIASFLIHIYYLLNENELLLFTTLWGLNRAEQLGEDAYRYQALFYAYMGSAIGIQGNHYLANRYIARSKNRLKTLSEELEARTKQVIGIYYFGQANWLLAETYFREGSLTAETIGDSRLKAECDIFHASMLYWKGDWADSFSMFDEVSEQINTEQNPQIMAFIYYAKAIKYFHNDDIDQAIENAKKIRVHTQDDLPNIMALGLLSKLYSLIDKTQNASESISELFPFFESERLTEAGALEGLFPVAEFLLEQYRKDRNKQNEKNIKQLLKVVGKFSRKFKVGIPAYRIVKCNYLFLKGKIDAKQAIDRTKKAISYAHDNNLNMPYYVGQANFQLGLSIMNLSVKLDAKNFLEKAVVSFQTLNANNDLNRANSALSQLG